MERIFHYPNCTVRVHIPDRTPEQQKAWEQRIHKATEEFLIDVIKQQQKRKTPSDGLKKPTDSIGSNDDV